MQAMHDGFSWGKSTNRGYFPAQSENKPLVTSRRFRPKRCRRCNAWERTEPDRTWHPDLFINSIPAVINRKHMSLVVLIYLALRLTIGQVFIREQEGARYLSR